MAATWYAVTDIRHGEEKDGKNVLTTFAPGQKVTGLDVDTMKTLFGNGAISKTRPDWIPDEDEDDEEPNEGNVDETPAAPKKSAPTKATPTKATPATPSNS